MLNRTIRSLLVGHAPPYIIAEIGVNHDGSLERALDLVGVAADCGADAVKFQAFVPELLASPVAPLAEYQRMNLGRSGSQLELLRSLELGETALAACRKEARRRGLHFGCTPFDIDSLNMLLGMDPDFIKISSGDANNPVLLRAAREAGARVIVSTGMCDTEDVAGILRLFEEQEERLALLHCVSAYPAPLAECNLRAVDALRSRTCWTGFSDHTQGVGAAVAAVVLGARIIEKHITHDPGAPGPDHACSMDRSSFREFVRVLKELRVALGDGVKRVMPCERDTRRVARRSIAAARDLGRGAVLREGDLVLQRPGTGIPPGELESLYGRCLARELERGTLLTREDLFPERHPGSGERTGPGLQPGEAGR